MTQPAEAPVTQPTAAPVAPPPAPTAGAASKAAPPETSHQDRVAMLHARMQKEDGEPAKAAPEDAPEAKPEATTTADDDKTKAEAPKDPKEAKPEEKPAPKDEKLAARFAALAREQKSVVDGRAKNEADARSIQQRAQALDATHAERTKSLEAREARVREREEGDHKLLADTPEKVFQHLISLGVKSMADVEAIGNRVWGAHRAKLQAEATSAKPKEPDDPKDRPLTAKDIEKWETDRRQREEIAAAVEGYEKGFDKSKHEAAMLVFTRDDRIREGDRIGNALRQAGKYFTHDDLREAVNTLAESDPRWHARLEERSQRQVPGATAKTADDKSAPKQAASPTPETPRGHKTLSNDAVTETSSASSTDAQSRKVEEAKSGKDIKADRKKRLAALMGS